MTNGNADDKENLIPCGCLSRITLEDRNENHETRQFQKVVLSINFFICKRNIERKEWQSIIPLPGIVGSTSNEMLFDVAVFMSRE